MAETTAASGASPAQGRHAGPEAARDGEQPGVDEQPGSGERPGVDEQEMGRRGSLHLADRVVEKIAQAAALEVSGVAPAASTTSRFGSLFGRGYPSADVELAGRRGRVHIQVATLWPRPAAQVAAGVRESVSRRLRELAAVDVDSVAVSVAAVVRPQGPQKERVR